MFIAVSVLSAVLILVAFGSVFLCFCKRKGWLFRSKISGTAPVEIYTERFPTYFFLFVFAVLFCTFSFVICFPPEGDDSVSPYAAVGFFFIVSALCWAAFALSKKRLVLDGDTICAHGVFVSKTCCVSKLRYAYFSVFRIVCVTSEYQLSLSNVSKNVDCLIRALEKYRIKKIFSKRDDPEKNSTDRFCVQLSLTQKFLYLFLCAALIAGSGSLFFIVSPSEQWAPILLLSIFATLLIICSLCCRQQLKVDRNTLIYRPVFGKVRSYFARDLKSMEVGCIELRLAKSYYLRITFSDGKQIQFPYRSDGIQKLLARF